MAIEVTGHGPCKTAVATCEAGRLLILAYGPDESGCVLLRLADYYALEKAAKEADIAIVEGDPAKFSS